MKNTSKYLLTGMVVILLGLLACGCPAANTTTPAAPTPPQITAANIVKAIGDGANSATDAVIAARKAGTISNADATTAENALAAVATAGMQINAELQSTDTWAIQQQKIIGILQAVGLGQLQAHVSSQTYAIVAGVVTLANTLSAALGGPTL